MEDIITEQPIKRSIHNLPEMLEPFNSHCTSGMLKSYFLKISLTNIVILNMKANSGKLT